MELTRLQEQGLKIACERYRSKEPYTVIAGYAGTGKSTLLKHLVYGKNPAVKFGRFVKLAFYDQENANLDSENTVLDELWGRHTLWEQTRVRSTLARAGLFAEDMDKKVRMLSGGERAKLALAVFESENGNTLFLDEPTNHLDLPARESLESALQAFDGTILFVSHDRYFIRALAGKIIELENGDAHIFVGSYDEYTEQKRIEKATECAPTPTIAKKETGYRTKEERAKQAQTQTRIKQIEKEIALLETEEAQINAELATPEVSADFALLTQKCNRLEEIKNAIDLLYQEYETII